MGLRMWLSLARPAASVASLEIQRRNWKRNWYLEFASDMLAAYCVGPAFGWGNLRLVSLAGTSYNRDYHGENEGEQLSRMNVLPATAQ